MRADPSQTLASRHDGRAEPSPPTYRIGWAPRLPFPLRSLLTRWRSTVGMILGVGIALGIGMTLLGSTNAVTELYTGDYRVSDANLYVLTEGGSLIPVLPGDQPGTIKHARHVIGQIRTLPGVGTAVGMMVWTMEREREGPRHRDDPTELISTVGVNGDPTQVPGMLILRSGRWLQRTDEIVLGPKLSREKQLLPGSTVRLNGHDFTVVGIGRLRGIGYSGDAQAYLDYEAFRQRVDVGDVLNVIAVASSQPAVTQRQVLAMESLSTFSPDELIHEAEKAMEADLVSHWTLITLTLAIAGLFVSNMLGRSVVERRLEFATLRAIGLPTRTILFTVGAEAVLVSVAAWVVGIAVAGGMGWAINTFMAPAYGFDSLYSVSLDLFGLVLALSLGLGLVAGFFPARQATRVDPVAVLREA